MSANIKRRQRRLELIKTGNSRQLAGAHGFDQINRLQNTGGAQSFSDHGFNRCYRNKRAVTIPKRLYRQGFVTIEIYASIGRRTNTVNLYKGQRGILCCRLDGADNCVTLIPRLVTHGVIGAAVSSNLPENVGPARDRRFPVLQHQQSGCFTQRESCATMIERNRTPFAITVQQACPLKSAKRLEAEFVCP